MRSDMLKENFLSAYIKLLSWFQRNWKFAILPLAIYVKVVCIDNTQIIDTITVANNMFIVRFMQVTRETENFFLKISVGKLMRLDYEVNS